MAANLNGLIYYKLDAEVHGYPGDITKNCGLRGEEIDGNFNFLRGNDIKEISFDENGTLFVTKYDGNIISAKQVDTPDYDFKYEPETGILTIITPNNEEITLSGFKSMVAVYHDYTLEGFGTKENPLKVSNTTQPGTYKPAIKLIDTTKTDENGNVLEMLPVDNKKYDRYVTKETTNKFGKLYPLSGVKNINQRLAEINSDWHVPTKEEWDDMLNAVDCEKPDHGKTESNVELGKIAGTVLKSEKYWEVVEDDNLKSDDYYGFTVYPVGYCGNRGKNYYGNFGRSSAFWTATVEGADNDMYIKKFEYDRETVGQFSWGENHYLSLRLVKKYDGNNFYESETIDGFTVNCVHVPGSNTVWTKENIAFSQTQYDGFSPKEWDLIEINSNETFTVVKYYVNEWNGNGWDKHEIKEGETIVLHEAESGQMHEWMRLGDTLIDTNVRFKDELKIDELRDELIEEIETRTENNKNEIRQDLEKQINENKVVPENNSVTITPGFSQNDETTHTTIKVNLDTTCENLKLGENGIYFDGNFGQF